MLTSGPLPSGSPHPPTPSAGRVGPDAAQQLDVEEITDRKREPPVTREQRHPLAQREIDAKSRSMRSAARAAADTSWSGPIGTTTPSTSSSRTATRYSSLVRRPFSKPLVRSVLATSKRADSGVRRRTSPLSAAAWTSRACSYPTCGTHQRSATPLSST